LTILKAVHNHTSGGVRERGSHITGIGVDQVRFADGPRGAECRTGFAQGIGGHLAMGANGALEAIARFGALTRGTAIVVVLWEITINK